MKKIFEKIKSMLKPKMIFAIMLIVYSISCFAGVAESASGAITFWTTNKIVILTFLLALSEILALIPSLKSNGIIDGAIKFLRKILDQAKA